MRGSLLGAKPGLPGQRPPLHGAPAPNHPPAFHPEAPQPAVAPESAAPAPAQPAAPPAPTDGVVCRVFLPDPALYDFADAVVTRLEASGVVACTELAEGSTFEDVLGRARAAHTRFVVTVDAVGAPAGKVMVTSLVPVSSGSTLRECELPLPSAVALIRSEDNNFRRRHGMKRPEAAQPAGAPAAAPSAPAAAPVPARDAAPAAPAPSRGWDAEADAAHARSSHAYDPQAFAAAHSARGGGELGNPRRPSAPHGFAQPPRPGHQAPAWQPGPQQLDAWGQQPVPEHRRSPHDPRVQPAQRAAPTEYDPASAPYDPAAAAGGQPRGGRPESGDDWGAPPPKSSSVDFPRLAALLGRRPAGPPGPPSHPQMPRRF